MIYQVQVWAARYSFRVPDDYYIYIHLMAFFQDNLGKPAPER